MDNNKQNLPTSEDKQLSAVNDQSSDKTSDKTQESVKNEEVITKSEEVAVPESKTTEEVVKSEKTTLAEKVESSEPKQESEISETKSEAKSEVNKTSGEVKHTAKANKSDKDQDTKQVSKDHTEGESNALQSDDQTDVKSKQDNPNAKWYVVHTYSGHENKIAVTLKQRIESENLEKKILDVLVPMQEKIEIKGGKKVNVKEKIFPGYILVKMELDDVSWLAVRTIQGVTSFVGMGNKPTPISDAEVSTIIKFTKTESPMYKQVFAVSDAVKIVDGPFADFIGKIDSVDEEKGKARVLVSIFGRETPVELDFLQIKKI